MRAGASKSALLAPPSQIGAKSYRLIKRLGGHSNLDWAAVARLLEQSSYFSTRQVQKMHVARLKFPGPATEETWVTDADGDPVFMVIAEPSQSLAGQLRGLLPQLRQVVGDGGRVTVCSTGAAGHRRCSPTSPPPGSTCSPTARARSPTCLAPRSPGRLHR